MARGYKLEAGMNKSETEVRQRVIGGANHDRENTTETRSQETSEVTEPCQQTTKGKKEIKPIWYYLQDWANVCTITGAVFSCIAMAFISNEKYNMGAAFITLSNIMDCLDGAIARGTTNRDPAVGEFGAELDTLVDLINAGVVPGLLLMKVGQMQPLAVLVAVFYIICISIRQAYVTYYGLVQDGQYYIGMNTEFPAMLIGILSLSLPVVSLDVFCNTLMWMLPVLGLCCATRVLRTSVYGGRWLKIAVVYQLTVVVTNFMLEELHIDLNESNFTYITAALFIQGFLCYPCCLRHIEMNS